MMMTTEAASYTKQARMNVVAYLRVSTGRQFKEGYGLKDQEKQIRAWCRANGHRLVRVIIDGAKSGTLEAVDRPGLLDCLRAVKSGEADGIVMRDLDRLSRTLTIQEAVLAQIWSLGGHAFISTDSAEVPRDDPDDPMRTAMRQMTGVFAQLERAMANKRLRNGRAEKARSGGYAYGSPAYGQRAENKELTEDDTEAQGVERIRELAAEGLSLRAICNALDAEGIKSKRGGQWHPQTVQRVLARTEVSA